MSNGGKRRHLALLALVLGIGLAACSTSVASPPSTSTSSTVATTTLPPTTVGPPLPPGTPPSPTVLLPQIRSAVANAVGVHVVGIDRTVKTGAIQQFDDDLGLRTGRQQLSSAGARLEIRLTVTRAYLFGNSQGYTTFFGAPKSFMPPNPEDWYYVASTDSQYKQFKMASTVASLANNYLPLHQPVTDNKTTYNGQAVYELQWNQTPDKTGIAVTLYVPVTGAMLPIAEVAESPTLVQHTTFTNWNGPVIVSIPSPSVPLSQLFG